MVWSRISMRAPSVPDQGIDRMKSFADEPGTGAGVASLRLFAGSIFRKYAATFIIIICLALVVDEVPEIWFSYQ